MATDGQSDWQEGHTANGQHITNYKQRNEHGHHSPTHILLNILQYRHLEIYTLLLLYKQLKSELSWHNSKLQGKNNANDFTVISCFRIYGCCRVWHKFRTSTQL